MQHTLLVAREVFFISSAASEDSGCDTQYSFEDVRGNLGEEYVGSLISYNSILIYKYLRIKMYSC